MSSPKECFVPYIIVLERGTVVECLKQLGYGAESRRKFVSSRLGFAMRQLENSLSTQQEMGTFFELVKDKAARGEGWAPPFTSCAQDTVSGL